MLADEADRLIGVDTHRDTHTAAVVEPATGVVGERTTTAADSLGYKRLLAFAERHAPGRRVWAIESTGSFGAGLTSFLLERGERVVEVDRPKRPARRSGAKSDELDAIRAAQRCSRAPTRARRAGVASARRSGRCSAPARARCARARARSAT